MLDAPSVASSGNGHETCDDRILAQTWISTEEAAGCWSYIFATEISGPSVRRWCREGRLEELGIRCVTTGGGRYQVHLEDVLVYAEKTHIRLLETCRALRARRDELLRVQR